MCAHDSSSDTTSRIDVSGRDLVETFPRPGLSPESEYIDIIELPAKPADTVSAGDVLRPALSDPYPYDLFSHQADALDALGDGENVAVTTSTSSGKTHIYGLQIARNLLEAGVLNADGTRPSDRNSASTALCVYPMKALTKDQKEALEDLYEQLGLDVRVRIYDGDTTGDRRAIREQADVILTNFAGLNVYLEHHDKWSRFYSALDLVAVDESHTYTGIEGMHVAWIIRRMQRVADYWGGDPQYVLTSATIGNPHDHSTELINAPVTVVDDDGSPHGPRDIVLWNPPPRDKTRETTPGDSFSLESEDDTEEAFDDEFVAQRVPASVEAPKVFNHLTSHDVRTLLFCPSRKLTELGIQRADDHRRANPRAYDRSTTVDRDAYNAGLGRRTRHSREHQFKTGALTGLATTSALELGIDIGSLDATVLMGYPGQRQAFWQRIGRAGREASRSLAVLVGDHRTLDQYVLNNPNYVLETDVEDAVVDTSNNSVFATHVRCACDEIALDEADIGTFADEDRLRAAVKMWREAGFVDGYLDAAVHYSGPGRPQTRVNLYGTDDTDYHLRLADGVDRERWGLSDGLDLEPIDRNRAYRDYHEGAVRLQNGQQFEVVSVDEDRPQPVIELEPVDREYYTRSRNKVTVLDADSEQSRDINGFTLHFGRGTVVVHHHAYDQMYIGNSEPKQQLIPTETPPILMDTHLCWVEVPEDVELPLVRKYQEYGVETGVDPDQTGLAHLGYIAGLHAAEHATIQTAPLELRVDKNDLGGLATLVMDTHYTHPEYDDIADSIRGSFEAATHALERRTSDLSGHTASGWFIYDGVDGGLGFARAIYDDFEALAERARDQLRDCNCGQPNGCPACTFDENCGNDNKPLLRASAIDVLNQLLGDDDRDDLSEYRPEDHGGDRQPVVFYS
ncbi:DEAD/DEAH box helicase [Haloarchaeobius amylolyticus]|uniref:DEAD/DEAH box helicase n=1 Tax=Haloarchaeobius amylolyticus TaxID=1198296 RepID=A0ABD6BCY6_9EURY